jgi:hypothetical protein
LQIQAGLLIFCPILPVVNVKLQLFIILRLVYVKTVLHQAVLYVQIQRPVKLVIPEQFCQLMETAMCAQVQPIVINVMELIFVKPVILDILRSMEIA